MTARDDFDGLLTAWFDDDAPGREPEHLLGEVLARTARTRRRPAWLVPERWLPVQLVMARQSVPRLAPLVAVVALLIALLAAALFVAGRPRVPPPFGPAANGLMAYMWENRLVVGPVDGSEQRPVSPIDRVAGEPVFSPLGRQIAYKLFEFDDSVVRSSVYTADLASGVAVEVVPTGLTVSTPSWSPDEQSIVYSQPTQVISGERIFVVRADGSAPPTRIGPDVDSAAPVFSPDGERIAFLLLSDVGTLAVMDADGSNVRELASFPVIGGPMQHGGTGFAWSPDSRTLLVSAGSADDDQDLYTIAVAGPVDGGKPEVNQITRTALLEYGASWSPAGDRIAYHRGRLNDFPSVVVARPDGSEAEVISGNEQMTWLTPHWSPDSAYVVATTRGAGSRILLMDPDGERPFEVISPPEYQAANDNAPGGADVVAIQRRAP
jgi:Tol biopolymer transport system component